MKIILNSLPKSGTHLLSSLLNIVGFDEFKPGLTGALLRETHRNPFTNWKKRKRRVCNNESGFAVDLDIDSNIISSDWLGTFLEKIPDNSYVCSHLPYSLKLSNFLSKNGFKILFIIRDPRDVLNSYINYQKKGTNLPFHKEFNSMNIDECINHTLTRQAKKNLVSESLIIRLENSIGWYTDKNVCSTKFEKLIGPKGGGDKKLQLTTIDEILRYIGIHKDINEIKEIGGSVFNIKSSTFNKGLVGQWKNAFSKNQNYYINQVLKSYIEDLGYY